MSYCSWIVFPNRRRWNERTQSLEHKLSDIEPAPKRFLQVVHWQDSSQLILFMSLHRSFDVSNIHFWWGCGWGGGLAGRMGRLWLFTRESSHSVHIWWGGVGVRVLLFVSARALHIGWGWEFGGVGVGLFTSVRRVSAYMIGWGEWIGWLLISKWHQHSKTWGLSTNRRTTEWSEPFQQNKNQYTSTN